MSSKISELPATGITEPIAVAGPGVTPVLPELTPARRAWVENVTILLNHKKLILWTTLLVTAITAVYAFGFMPNYYKATAVVLPARKPGGGLDNMAASLTSSLKDLGLSRLTGSKGGDESYTPVSLIRSRELQQQIIRQFGLQQIYQAESMDEALKRFNENLDCDLNEEGNFSISFADVNPSRSANIVNALTVAINEVDSRLAQEEAVHNSKYITERYQKNIEDLDSAEAALGQFEKEHGIYVLEEQAKAELGAVAEIEQQKSMAEIQLRNVLDLYGSNASEAVALKNSIDGLSQKLEQMRTGMDTKASSFVPTNVLPEAALQFLRLTREVEIQSKLKAFFLPMYEQAKLDEHRNLLSFVVLDHGVPPSKKAGPHRSLLLLGAMLSTAFVSIVLTLTVSRFHSIRAGLDRDRAIL
jgi:uncharacterized protein involved in exopolysaccharide biosynthesis